MDDATRTELEAAAFRRLRDHLASRPDVQNIELMNLAGFCRNCLSRWWQEAAESRGIAVTKDEARALATVEATYDKLMLFCPKCGRRLLHPGADCINCQSKGKTFTKLARYLKPEIPNLIVCLFLSLISTALTMV